MMKKSLTLLAFVASLLFAPYAFADGNQTPPIPVIAGNGLTKTGNTIDLVATSGGGLTVAADSVGLLTTCATNQTVGWNGTVWGCMDGSALAGAGDITAVTAGTGLSGGGTSGAVTLTVNIAGGACAAGQAVTSISSTGTATCSSSVSAVSAGNGITASTTSGTATVSVNNGTGLIFATGALTYDNTIIQSRVSGTCTSPNAIASVASNGTVTCTTGVLNTSNVSGTSGNLAAFTGTNTVGNFAGSSPAACGVGQVMTRVVSATTGVLTLTCTAIGTQGGVTGTGGTGVVAVWNGSTSLGTGGLSDNGSTVSTSAENVAITHTGNQTSALSGTYSGTAQIITHNAVGATNSGSYDTTSGALTAYGVKSTISASRSTGANNLTNIALYGTASGAQVNVALQTDAGDVLLNQTGGNTSIGGGLTVGSFNAQQNGNIVAVTVTASDVIDNGVAGLATLTAHHSSAAQTANLYTVNADYTGTTNTTAGALTSYAGSFSNTGTRSAGANNLTNVALYATASGAQVNTALQTDTGDVALNQTGGSFLIGASKFTVAPSTGNTVVAGTLQADGTNRVFDLPGTNLTRDGTNANQINCANFASGTGGCVPASGGGTTNFLRADGTWAAAGGGGGITNSAGNNVITKSNGTNLVASGLLDDGTTVSTTEAVSVGALTATSSTHGLISPAALGAATVNDWSPTGLSGAKYIIVTPFSSTTTLTGIDSTGFATGHEICLENNSATIDILLSQATGSVAANQFHLLQSTQAKLRATALDWACFVLQSGSGWYQIGTNDLSNLAVGSFTASSNGNFTAVTGTQSLAIINGTGANTTVTVHHPGTALTTSGFTIVADHVGSYATASGAMTGTTLSIGASSARSSGTNTLTDRAANFSATGTTGVANLAVEISASGGAVSNVALQTDAGDINLGATSGNLTFGTGATTAQTTTLNGQTTVAYGASAGTVTNNVLTVNQNGTYNTTGGGFAVYGGYFNNTATKSSGAALLTAYGLYATATGADTNYAAWFDGDVLVKSGATIRENGTGTLTLDASGGTIQLGTSVGLAVTKVEGVLYAAGTSPTVGTCGTTPSITGQNNGGTVTVGTGTVTACTVTFGNGGFTAAPACTITNEFNGTTWISAKSSSSFTVTASATMGGSKFDYTCIGI